MSHSDAGTPILGVYCPKKRSRHTKSRTGCGICKRRKIKCDEERPACRNCLKHSVQCDFGSSPAPILVPVPVPVRVSVPATPGHHSNSPGASQPELLSSPDDGGGGAPALNTMHLELLHNYITSTVHSFSPVPVLRNLWRIDVPQLGLSFGFVMRGILALSAMHLARAHAHDPHKRDRYLAIAAAEHNAALPTATALLRRADADNCVALYIFSTLTFIYAVAAPRRPGSLLLTNDDDGQGSGGSGGSGGGKADWLVFLHGVRHVREMFHEQLVAGPFSAMFALGGGLLRAGEAVARSSSPDWRATDEYAALSELHRLLVSGTTVSPCLHDHCCHDHHGHHQSSSLDPEKLAACRQALDDLEISFCAFRLGLTSAPAPPPAAVTKTETATTTDQSPSIAAPSPSLSPPPPPPPLSLSLSPTVPSPPTSVVYAWLYRLTPEFVDLVSRREPEALVIFAHFCVLLKALDGCWWMAGWSVHLLQEIWGALGHQYRPWIRWAIEEVGWVPTTD